MSPTNLTPRPGAPDPELEPARLPFSFAYAALLTVMTAFFYTLVAMIVGQAGSLQLGHGLGIALGFGNALALAYRRVPRPLRARFALRPPRAGAWLAPFLLLPALLLISELDNLLVALLPPAAPPPTPEPGADAPAQLEYSVALALFIAAVIRPLAVEGFFRGLVYERLEAIWPPLQVIIATTLLSWAYAALSSVLITQGLLSGVQVVRVSIHALGAAALLGTLRHCSGSLYPPLLLAALFGITEVLGTQDALGIPGFDDASAAHTPLAWLLPAAALTGVGLRLCQRMLREAEAD